MITTDKPSAIDALIQKLEDSIRDKYWFNEVQDMLIELKGKVESDKQAYAAQQVKAALEKVKVVTDKNISRVREISYNDYSRPEWQTIAIGNLNTVKGLVDNILSESSGEKQ